MEKVDKKKVRKEAIKITAQAMIILSAFEILSYIVFSSFIAVNAILALVFFAVLNILAVIGLYFDFKKEVIKVLEYEAEKHKGII